MRSLLSAETSGSIGREHDTSTERVQELPTRAPANRAGGAETFACASALEEGVMASEELHAPREPGARRADRPAPHPGAQLRV